MVPQPVDGAISTHISEDMINSLSPTSRQARTENPPNGIFGKSVAHYRPLLGAGVFTPLTCEVFMPRKEVLDDTK